MSEELEPEGAAKPRDAGRARRVDDPAVLVAIAAVVVGALWLGVVLQPGLPQDDSADAGFARDMIVHHAQAVEMAEILRSRTRDPEIRILATDIALTQQAQIGQMRGWLDVWDLPQASSGPRMAWMGHAVEGPMPGMASATEVAELGRASPELADVQFLRLMIPHHQAAIEMSEAALELADRPEARALAEGIIQAQRSEISYMQDLLRRREAPPVTDQIQMPAEEAGSGHGEEEGFAASVPSTVEATARGAPLVLAALALGWLVVDTVRRRRPAAPGSRPQGHAARNAWVDVAVGSLIASALLHGGLVPAHFDEDPAYGWFFVVAAALATLVAALVLAWPSRPAYLAGATLSLLLIAAYVVFRLVPPPGADAAEGVELVGLLTKAAEVAALVSCAALWSFSRSSRFSTSRDTSEALSP